MARRRYKKLVDMKLGVNKTNSGVAGVDHPAHQAEGWLVMKHAAPDESNAANTVEAVEKGHEELMIALQRATYLKNAPDVVQQAVRILKDWIAAFASDAAEDDAQYVEEHVTRNWLDETDLPEDMKKAIEPVFEALNEFLTPDDEQQTVTMEVGGQTIVIREGEQIEKHRGIARRRFQRLESAVQGLRQMFDLFAPEEAKTEEEVMAEDKTTVETEATVEADAAVEAEVAVTETTEEIAAAVEVEAEAEAAVATDEVEAVAAAAPTSEEIEELVTKAVEGALSTAFDAVIEKLVDFKKSVDELSGRVETVEKTRGVRRSLDGQDQPVKKSGMTWGILPQSR